MADIQNGKFSVRTRSRDSETSGIHSRFEYKWIALSVTTI